MTRETRVKAKVLLSFASPAPDGVMRGYQPGTIAELPGGLAADWADVGYVELVEPEPVTSVESEPAPRRGRPPLPRNSEGNIIRE
jgi:hypothetical protein